METLWFIPARGGSKGIPDKNVKPFCGESLVSRSVRQAIECASQSDTIYVSTESEIIRREAEKHGIQIPFMRPIQLAGDSVATYPVIIDALKTFSQIGKDFNRVVLLQPTSPLRITADILDALSLWNPDIDMVVSVKKSTSNPYYNLFEEDSRGFLKISKGEGTYTRRQDAPPVWEYNGAVYVISVPSLLKEPIGKFKKIIPYEMPASRSLDLDTPEDWMIAEMIYRNSFEKV